MEVERQHFRTIAEVEIHQARLELVIDSTEREVPADAIAGHPYNVEYVENSGLLVLTNSATRLGPFAYPRESNEDRGDLNAVEEEFGIEYLAPIESSEAVVVGEHALVGGVDTPAMVPGNGVALSAVGVDDLALAQADGTLVAVHVAHGEAGGEVVALGDVGMLVSQGCEPSNFRFWKNLAQYAASR